MKKPLRILSVVFTICSLSSCGFINKFFSSTDSSSMPINNTPSFEEPVFVYDKIEIDFSKMDASSFSRFSGSEMLEFEHQNMTYNLAGCCLDESENQTYLKFANSTTQNTFFANALCYEYKIKDITIVMRGGNSSKSQLLFLVFGKQAFTSPITNGINTIGYGESKTFAAPQDVDFFLISGYGNYDAEILSITLTLNHYVIAI